MPSGFYGKFPWSNGGVNPFANGGGLLPEPDSTESEDEGASHIPPEVYELMAIVINFAQELSDEWEKDPSL